MSGNTIDLITDKVCFAAFQQNLWCKKIINFLRMDAVRIIEFIQTN